MPSTRLTVRSSLCETSSSSRAETARVLRISEEAGAKRYYRALKQLKTVLSAMPVGCEGL
jgi:hypothetical protein